LELAVHFELDALLGGEHALEVTPGAAAGKRHLIGEDFFRFGHLIAAFLRHLEKPEGVVLRRAGDFKGFFQSVAEGAEPGTDAHK